MFDGTVASALGDRQQLREFIGGIVRGGEKVVGELNKSAEAKPPRPPRDADAWEIADFIDRRRDRRDQYRALSAENKVRKFWEACTAAPAGSAAARELLHELLADEVLDDKMANAARMALMKGGDPQTLAQLDELLGEMQPDGTRAPNGALSVAKYNVQRFKEYLHEAAPDPAREQAALLEAAKVTVDVDGIRLPEAAAKDVATYRAVREVAAARGLPLIVVSSDGRVEEGFRVEPTNANGAGTVAPPEAK